MELDFTQFDRGLQMVYRNTPKTLTEVVNQRALNVAGRAFEGLPPSKSTVSDDEFLFGGTSSAVEAKRWSIRRFLREPLSTRITLFKSGKRKGQIGRKGGRNKQLQRVHLIVQARRARAGKKGL